MDNVDKIALAKTLECALCLSLICEPITVPCGHSFCRCCLIQALHTCKKCPSCRAVCNMMPETAEVSIILRNLALQIFPDEYTRRIGENVLEKSTWRTTLGAIPTIYSSHASVAPGMKVQFDVVEPQYRLMLKRIIETNRMFAYVPGIDDPDRGQVGDIALLAVVDTCTFYADGHAKVTCQLRNRHVICDLFIEECSDQLQMCCLETLSDDAASSARCQPLMDALRSRELRQDKDTMQSCGGGVCPEDAEGLSLWMMVQSPLSLAEKRRLLGTKDSVKRMEETLTAWKHHDWGHVAYQYLKQSLSVAAVVILTEIYRRRF
jgi:hypothetical protein